MIRDRIKKYIGVFIAIPILIFMWYMLYLIVDSRIVPNPFDVFKMLPIILKDEETFLHVAYSLSRVLIGLSISLVFGTFIGVLMGMNEKVDKVLNPIVYLMYPVPKLALLPTVILTLGLKESSKITMIILIVIFQIITAIRGAVINIPKSNYMYFNIMGANKIKTFMHVTAPIILKELFIILKISTGTAISVLFFTETYGTRYGLGFYIMDCFQTVDYVEMYAGIVILSSIGFTLFFLIDLLETIFTPWSK